MTNKENDKASELFDLYNSQPGINDVWEWMAEYIDTHKVPVVLSQKHINEQIKQAQLELLEDYIEYIDRNKCHIKRYQLVNKINQLKKS